MRITPVIFCLFLTTICVKGDPVSNSAIIKHLKRDNVRFGGVLLPNLRIITAATTGITNDNTRYKIFLKGISDVFKITRIVEKCYTMIIYFTSSQQFFTNVEIPPVAIDTCHESILPDAPCLVVHRDMFQEVQLLDARVHDITDFCFKVNVDRNCNYNELLGDGLYQDGVLVGILLLRNYEDKTAYVYLSELKNELHPDEIYKPPITSSSGKE